MSFEHIAITHFCRQMNQYFFSGAEKNTTEISAFCLILHNQNFMKSNRNRINLHKNICMQYFHCHGFGFNGVFKRFFDKNGALRNEYFHN